MNYKTMDRQDLVREVERLHAELRELWEIAENSDAILAQKIEKAHDEIERLRASYQSLWEDGVGMRHENASLVRQRQIDIAEIERLKAQRDAAETTRDEVLRNYASTPSEMALAFEVSRDDRAGCEAEILRTKEELTVASDEIERLKEDENKHERECSTLENEIERLREGRNLFEARLAAEIAKLKGRISRLAPIAGGGYLRDSYPPLPTGGGWQALALCQAHDEIKRLKKHETETREYIRSACDEIGDLDWDDSLHLGDVVEKHLARPASYEIRILRSRLEEAIYEIRTLRAKLRGENL